LPNGTTADNGELWPVSFSRLLDGAAARCWLQQSGSTFEQLTEMLSWRMAKQPDCRRRLRGTAAQKAVLSES
jgi:hypothetical protein